MSDGNTWEVLSKRRHKQIYDLGGACWWPCGKQMEEERVWRQAWVTAANQILRITWSVFMEENFRGIHQGSV